MVEGQVLGQCPTCVREVFDDELYTCEACGGYICDNCSRLGGMDFLCPSCYALWGDDRE